MPETSETAESEKIGPDDLEKKRDKTSMFTTVLYRIGLKDFDAILVPC